jgi:hypothetical protein
VKAELWDGSRKGAKAGFLVGLCIAVPYLVIGALGDVELDKSLGFSLLLVGFPSLFAIVPLIEWLGLQGGTREGVLLLLSTLALNGALWGALIGAALALRSLAHRPR